MKINIAIITFYTLLIAGVGLANASEFDKQVKLEHVTINYKFKDTPSLNLEPKITSLISEAFVLYSRLFDGPPRDLSGEKYTEFSVHVKHGKYLGGEADPGIVMLTWNDKNMFGFASWQTLLLHELFHLWNAESFRYKDGREHWFNEGVTEYYTYRTAYQLGLISAKEALSIASKPVGFYSSSRGLGKISMREAGASNKTKFNNYFLVYHGGWLVTMILDHEIRKQTEGDKSLDDLMRWLYKNFHRNEKLYDNNNLMDGLLEITGVNYHQFIDKYVDGEMRVPVSDYFPLSDAVWAFEFGRENKQDFYLLYQTLGITLK